MLLGLLVIYILVITKYSHSVTYNKLTLRPYQYLIGYSILSSAQFVVTAEVQSKGFHAYFINVNKINCIYAAFGYQIYEWFNAYLIMEFQKPHGIENVHIEGRK